MTPTILEILLIVIPVLFALTGVGWRVFRHWIPGWAHTVLERTAEEVRTEFHRTQQTYTDIVRRGRADGVLTPQERREAFERTMDGLRRRVSWEHLSAALLRIFGVGGEDAATEWVTSQIERVAAEESTIRRALAVDPTSGARSTR